MHCCRVTAILFGYVAILFSVISVLSPGWLHNVVTRAGIGFLQTCREGICIDVASLVLADTEVRTSFTFMVIGTVMLIFSVIVMSSGGDEKRMRSLRFGGNMSIISGIFILVAAAIYTNYFLHLTKANTGVEFGYSYVLAWVTCVVAIMAGLFTLCAKKPKKKKVANDVSKPEEKDAEKQVEKPKEEAGESSKADEATTST